MKVFCIILTAAAWIVMNLALRSSFTAHNETRAARRELTTQTAQTAAATAKVKALEAENAQLNAIAVSAIAAELECHDRFDRTFKRNYAGN